MYNNDNNLYQNSSQNVPGTPADEQLRYQAMYRNTAQEPPRPQYSEPVPPPPQPPKKRHTGVKIAALALVCALLGGIVGAGTVKMMGGGRPPR